MEFMLMEHVVYSLSMMMTGDESRMQKDFIKAEKPVFRSLAE